MILSIDQCYMVLAHLRPYVSPIDKKLQIPDTAGDLGRRRQQSCEGMYYCDQQ